MNPALIIRLLPVLIPALWWVKPLYKHFFDKKKSILIGLPGAGKSTFLRHLVKDGVPEGPSGSLKEYKVDTAQFKIATDFSGADAFQKKLDKTIQGYNYILIFFDVSQYIENNNYRIDSNARMDFIHRHSGKSTKILLVGTHIDEAPNNYKTQVESSLVGKSYAELLNRIVYVNTTKEKCVKQICEALKK